MTLKLFLVGFGHVGQGFADLILKKRSVLLQKYNLDPIVVGIVTGSKGKIVDERGIDLSFVLQVVGEKQTFARAGLKTNSKETIELIKETDFDVLVEVSHTNLRDGQPASDYIRTALQSGKHVITTNKGPVALHLQELEAIAREKSVSFRYEGTVMAGTPLLNLIRYNLAGLQISKIQGIVNGSTNYILTRMEQGLEYEQAVAEARELGYLEADPTADVEGWDAVAKAMILSAAVFKNPLSKTEVRRQGITHLRRHDLEQAAKEHKTWKLIATVEKSGQGVRASVKPELLSKSHPLAAVQGATNAVTITTDYLHEVTIVGPGAGEHETGYAVLNDLLNLSREVTGA